jgi:hypothetical protein
VLRRLTAFAMAFGMAAVAAGVWGVLSRSRSQPVVISARPLRGGPQPVAKPAGPQPPGPSRWLVLILALAGAAALIWLSADLYYRPSAYAALAAATAVLSAIGLRGPRRRYGVFGSILLMACGTFAVISLIMAVIFNSDSDDGSLYSLLLLALCATASLAVVAWMMSTWGILGRRLEPVALVVVASVLAGMSLLGIYSAGTTIESEPRVGSGTLYVSVPNLEMNLEVSASAAYPTIPGEGGPLLRFIIDISPPTSGNAVRWALILTGEAKILPNTLRGTGTSVRDETLAESSFDSGQVQVVSGILHNGVATFTADAEAPLAVRSASRTAVSFPRYGTGNSQISQQRRALLSPAIGLDQFAPSALAVTLDAGSVAPLETLSQANPSPTTLGRLRWQAKDQLESVSYVTFNQRADDVARNKLFAVAVFLSTAAACLVSAMQSALHMRRSPSAGSTM